MKPMNEEHLAILRRHMIELIEIHGDLMEEELGKAVLNEQVLAAMLRVPRHLDPKDVVLEIGTGLGYQAALIAELASQVWSVEIVEEFADEAERRLNYLGYLNVGVRAGDGVRGWIEHSPYDKILLTAAADRPPTTLLEQLKPGGRMVLPMGPADAQRLAVIDMDANRHTNIQELIPVRFSLLETA